MAKRIEDLTAFVPGSAHPTDTFVGVDRVNDDVSSKVSLRNVLDLVQVWSEVANKAARPTVTATNVGYRAKVLTNGLTYVWDGTAWDIDDPLVKVTAAELAALSELEDGQLATVTDTTQGLYQYSTSNGWQRI